MAKIKYLSGLGDLGQLSDFYSANNLVLDDKDSGKHRAVYVDSVSHNEFVLTGDDFAYKGDKLISGTVDGVNFHDENGKGFITATDAHFTVSDFNNTFAVGGLEGVLALALAGKDKITGSLNADLLFGGGQNDTIHGGGDGDQMDGGIGNDKLYGDAGTDILSGGAGNDKMWGGAQSDMFHFESGGGSDTVMDFELHGGKNHDFVLLNAGDKYTQTTDDDKNVVLDFGGGDTLTLLHVHEGDFDASYIHVLQPM